MSNAPSDRILGTYHNVAFVGTVRSTHTDWHGNITFHTSLDHPIMVMGSERVSLAVTVRTSTLRDEEYGSLVTYL